MDSKIALEKVRLSDLEKVRLTVAVGVNKLDREAETHECHPLECKTHGCEPRVIVACHRFLRGEVPAGQCIICRTKGQTLFEIRTRGRTAAPAIICLACGTVPTVKHSTAILMQHAPMCLACDRRCQIQTGLGDQIFAICSDECSTKITDRISAEFQKEAPEGAITVDLKMCAWCSKVNISAMWRCDRSPLCTMAIYCSHACQEAAWPTHQKDCGRM
jgi:hypothetical protein